MKKTFLEKPYSQEEFLQYLSEFLPDFKKDIRSADKLKNLTITDKINFLGLSDELNLEVFEITHHKSLDARVSLATDGFKIMKQRGVYTALVVYKSLNNNNWRLSLMTTSLSVKKGKVKEEFSNPRRYSFYLGPDAKVNTPFRFLLNKGKIKDFDDLKSRFSIEVVNKEFYKQISQKFTQLVGGTLGKGKKKTTYKPLLKLPSVQDHSQTSLEFAVRLIGRIIFCWFLREKKSEHDKSLMPNQLLSLKALDKYQDYYHKVLEPIFFEVLNKPEKQRRIEYDNEPFSLIPYLNGGLFTPNDDDFYKRLNGDFQSQHHNTLVIPDEWFKQFFEILETYNFTIDENTTFDEELSIDPEMLGRIFENLLAEINPETGESARKSTGSYYTPRIIVDYMVDESLLLYLKQKTKIKEDKLRAMLSYDLTDDETHPLNSEEKQKITDALENLKLLDPACGSGAFPIGALQKMVFVLQQIDPDGQLWFKKQIQSTPPELRRVIEREFKHQNFDYIRKLGIIRKNIYGIDIQPIATEISRLRCFLTLVVDQYVSDGEENRGIEPLPNLDFKFVTANTLIPLPSDNKKSDPSKQIEMFDNYQKIDGLKQVRDQYFSASGIEREQLKGKFNKLQKDLVFELVQEHGYMSLFKAELTEKLTSWDPFSHKASAWFDPEWMFGIKDGFDIVIANPPYIKEYTKKDAFNGLRESPYYKGKMDIWYMFACKGIDWLEDKGVLTFIAQNNWITSYGASKMRNKIIEEAKLINLTDFGNYKIFESAGIQTMVMLFQKDTKIDKYRFDLRRIVTSEITHNDIVDLISKQNNSNVEYITPEVVRKDYLNQPLTFNNLETEIVLEKIKQRANFFLNAKEITNGIHSHHEFVNKARQKVLGNNFQVGNGIFVLSEEEKTLLNFNNHELKLIKSYYTSKELHKWWGTPKNQYWIIYTNSRFKNLEQIKPYPNIKRHLDKFQKIITSDNRPYGLHRSRNENFFIGEKIVAIRKCAHPTFTYIDFDCYVPASFYVIKTGEVDLKFLTALLNSQLVTFWLKHKGKMQGNNYQIDKEPLLNLCLIKPTQEQQNLIIKIVDQILSVKKHNPQADIIELEQQIDQQVYKLYDLTPEEIEIVENNTK